MPVVAAMPERFGVTVEIRIALIVPDGECKRLSTPRALFRSAKNRGGARIANHCDAGAGERFLKAFPFPRLPIARQGNS